jgi:hypothetical protein
MDERAKFIRHREAYMLIGDLDKPFHMPECCCEDCEHWRQHHDRPTHAELTEMPRQPSATG